MKNEDIKLSLSQNLGVIRRGLRSYAKANEENVVPIAILSGLELASMSAFLLFTDMPWFIALIASVGSVLLLIVIILFGDKMWTESIAPIYKDMRRHVGNERKKKQDKVAEELDDHLLK